jgi:hypothetical protein
MVHTWELEIRVSTVPWESNLPYQLVDEPILVPPVPTTSLQKSFLPIRIMLDEMSATTGMSLPSYGFGITLFKNKTFLLMPMMLS